ncbi:MAG TPA: aromatic ring-hydroxylating dioxygenase subunit alpha [Methylomirabilota bacterium]|nr:aromatic ring-hydroxylating dioxygenase subunit alpha [Methylomirabilota bacterium]
MSVTGRKDVDTGTGYGRPLPTAMRELTDVGPGTPMGELLRRYWHPVGLVGDAAETPRALRALGEDLVLFRDGRGWPGLVTARCAHRGTTLYYGRVEERGIRCCYHGWLFDVEGHCLEQPCEPDGGRQRERMRQPWYPVRERYGLIFAYMGPPDRKPALPRYEPLERLDPDELLEANDQSIGGGGPAVIPCNWLQHYENLMDTLHVPILHGSFSGPQFTAQMGLMPAVTWEMTDKGVKAVSDRRLPDGRVLHRISEAVLPTLRVIPNPRVAQYARVETIGWVLPIDDTSFRIYTAGRVRTPGEIAAVRSRLNGKLWEELSAEEHQRFPGDYEAQVGQGPITRHSEENLVSSDRGVALVRRALRQQLEALAAGRDPVGVTFDEDAPPVVFEAGNFLIEERHAS